MTSDKVTNCLTRRYPAYFSGYEETKHYFSTKAEFLKIEWLVNATAGFFSCYGLYKMKIGERHALVVVRQGIKIPIHRVIGWFTFPPEFLNEWKMDGQTTQPGLSPSAWWCLWVRIKWKWQDIKKKLFGRRDEIPDRTVPCRPALDSQKTGEEDVAGGTPAAPQPRHPPRGV